MTMKNPFKNRQNTETDLRQKRSMKHCQPSSDHLWLFLLNSARLSFPSPSMSNFLMQSVMSAMGTFCLANLSSPLLMKPSLLRSNTYAVQGQGKYSNSRKTSQLNHLKGLLGVNVSSEEVLDLDQAGLVSRQFLQDGLQLIRREIKVT